MFVTTKVPKKYAEPLVAGHQLSPTTALQACTSWRREGPLLLVLWGPPGTGKSTAAAWAVHDWWGAQATRDPWGKLKHPEGRLWIAAQHLARLQPWSDEALSLERAGLLVIDDVGEEEGTPKSLAMLSGLLTGRFAEALPTIITTNLDGRTFRDRYGGRLIDRIRECGLDERGKARWWVQCAGESLRGQVEPRPIEVPEETAEEALDDAAEPLAPERVAGMAKQFLRAIQDNDWPSEGQYRITGREDYGEIDGAEVEF